MSEKNISLLWLLALTCTIGSSWLTQSYFMPEMTVLQRLDLRKQYDDCVQGSGTRIEYCFDVRRMRERRW